MTKLLVFLLLVTFAVAVLSARDNDGSYQEGTYQQQGDSHQAKCARLLVGDRRDPAPEDANNCLHECVIYKKYVGGYRENGACRCC
ncbi:hypothetical protein KQX54_002545 [Cotesia glomerata]|uniref:Uncharacterized protein n=1 Tax=Cotesia glomerata TaxID=32391 RepID=A0AAV7HUD6_COTGL|nr:hypothetical protein KQX54_002545 [Cotesia glomerata]